MMRNLLFVFVMLLGVFTMPSCKKGVDTSNYMYQNNFDYYKDYGYDHATLRSGNAHSGEWYCELDTNNPYSITYSKKIADLPVKNIKKIKMSAWLYLPSFNSKASIVVTVGELGKDAATWNGVSTEKNVEEEKQWVQLTGEFEMPQNMNPNHTLQVYVWNHGKETVWCDDMAFDFE